LQQTPLGQSVLVQHSLQVPLQVFGLFAGQTQVSPTQVDPAQHRPPTALQPVCPTSRQV
jgi:hypothetical protein